MCFSIQKHATDTCFYGIILEDKKYTRKAIIMKLLLIILFCGISAEVNFDNLKCRFQNFGGFRTWSLLCGVTGVYLCMTPIYQFLMDEDDWKNDFCPSHTHNDSVSTPAHILY